MLVRGLDSSDPRYADPGLVWNARTLLHSWVRVRVRVRGSLALTPTLILTNALLAILWSSVRALLHQTPLIHHPLCHWQLVLKYFRY